MKNDDNFDIKIRMFYFESFAKWNQKCSFVNFLHMSGHEHEK
jgi:hypothetical protein